MRNSNNTSFVDAFKQRLKQFNHGHPHCSTTNIEEIVELFGQLSRKPYHVNMHWPMGWHQLKGCDLNGDIMELNFGAIYEMRPRRLDSFYFRKDPDLSFMIFEKSGLKPTGIYDNLEGVEHEEYVLEYHQGKKLLLPRESWDINAYEHEGRLISLSKKAELRLRELESGYLLIASIGSKLNDIGFEQYKKQLALEGPSSTLIQRLEREL